MVRSNAALAALLVVGCRAPARSGPALAETLPRPPPVAAAPGAPLPTPERLPRVPSSLPPAGGSAPSGPAWMACLEGYAPTASARVEATRLGLSCGPSTGLSLAGRLHGEVGEGARLSRHEWEAKAGDCFRVFAVADDPVADLEAEVRGPGGARFLDDQDRRWLVLGKQGPFCAERAGTFSISFGTHGGHGAVAAEVWRGEHLATVPGAPPG